MATGTRADGGTVMNGAARLLLDVEAIQLLNPSLELRRFAGWEGGPCPRLNLEYHSLYY